MSIEEDVPANPATIVAAGRIECSSIASVSFAAIFFAPTIVVPPKVIVAVAAVPVLFARMISFTIAVVFVGTVYNVAEIVPSVPL